jgi:hypothetical protein
VQAAPSIPPAKTKSNRVSFRFASTRRRSRTSEATWIIMVFLRPPDLGNSPTAHLFPHLKAQFTASGFREGFRIQSAAKYSSRHFANPPVNKCALVKQHIAPCINQPVERTEKCLLRGQLKETTLHKLAN